MTHQDRDHKGPDRAESFSTAGITFYSQFERTGVLSDLEEAIDNQQQAVMLTPDNHPDRPARLNNLGVYFESRFGRTGMLSDLEEAIKNKQQAVLLTPDNHPDKPSRLSNLGVSLTSQFGRTGMLSALKEAIENLQQAVLLTPDDHPDKPARLNNLGISFETWFGRTGTLSNLEEAIKHKQQAVALTPDGHPNKPIRLSNLGVSFETRFRRTGVLSDLEEAIKNKQQAVLLSPDGHPNKPGWLTNLGVSFASRFRRTGMLSDLDEAIKNHQQAVLLTPDDNPNKPIWLTNPGISFQSRFERTGMLSDLEEAIKNLQQAVVLTPDDHPNKPARLSNLGVSFKSHFEHTGILSDLEEAKENLRQAVLLTPDDHPDKPTRLNNLGASFTSQFGHTGMLSDLEEAIPSLRRAVSLTPDDHPDKPARLNNLGASFESRFRCTGMLNDLEEAIKNQQQAVLLTPDGHPDKTAWLSNLAISFRSRFHHTGSSNDLDNAISHFRSAATSNIGLPSLRSRASRDWARLEARRDPPSALAAYRRAIDLIPQVAWIGAPIVTRHSQLNGLGDISREAAVFALYVGQPDLALEWLEQGRSVVWNQLFNLRTSVHDLRQAYPDICTEFAQVSHELWSATTREHARMSDGVKLSLEDETQQHHRLAEKWDTLVETIRSLPEFGDFLLPKKIAILKDAASSGPVVVINVHPHRCDALVLERNRDQVLHIPLDKLHYGDVDNMWKSLRRDLSDHGSHCRGSGSMVGNPLLVGILSKLYSSIVDPILNGLGLKTGGSDPSNLPRIWWCPTGPLTFLPLHAACRHPEARIDGTFNYVISSYTPTVNALLEARAVKQRPFSQFVGISMSNTPGRGLLPCAETEMTKIGALFSADSRWRFQVLRNEQVTGKQVLTHMASSSWVHLACHAVQDGQEPTQSGFYLHDRRLSITNIVANPFANADFAFLSACETATGDEKTLDEAVHITGAMLGAGYRSVIGTMWAILDEAAPMIAEKVYSHLLSEGEPNSERAARALHEAVKKLRELSPDSFDSWVPFVHYGV